MDPVWIISGIAIIVAAVIAWQTAKKHDRN
jgi:hypothetical protein